MLINSHYPQVPLATSNVATDLARADNQQRPPIIPPQQPSKGHEERAYNPQNERAPAYSLLERQHQQQHSASQRQAFVQQLLSPSPLVAQTIKVVADDNPTLLRKDIRSKHRQDQQDQTNRRHSKMAKHTDAESAVFYQQVRDHLERFYNAQPNPHAGSMFSVVI
ncbi:hypothetical protein [Shewanella aestuarii]|uniref:Uncharacterized protein n=1 Tax=Shewanella aestuarii TaxID=1028752 RepID=A0A6G9QMR7_9GAMM|nr:hypothetical protein [Shewanella aestuarii]QIR15890.1 hypothetical protein HBH39_16555 [Shewanella aestuarii]